MEIACWEYNEYLSKEQKNEVDEWQMKQLKESNSDIKECPCGNTFIAVPGNVDYGYKDEQGKAISDEAAVHMSINRINCPKCHLIYC